MNKAVKILRVFEHTKVKYDDNGDFKKSHFDNLVLFNEQHKNKYFTIIHKGILFNSYVGVIQSGNLILEILPKVDNQPETDNTKLLWQDILIRMLKVCNYLKVDNVSEASLKKRYNSLMDIYFEMFISEVENLVRSGLIKKYQKNQNNSTALKGKLLFSKNIQKNLTHKERFFCEFQEYNKDHLIHQILLRALSILDTFPHIGFQDRINRLLLVFSDYKQVNIASSHFESIVYNRKNKVYSKAIEIAKMIILNYSSNLNGGKTLMLTLLFDMNNLWEEFIHKILHKHNFQSLLINAQSSKTFWANKTIRPDIVIEKESKTIVVDTKWKVIQNNNPSDDDVKQMFAYNLVFKAERSYLLYPRVNQMDSDYGEYTYIHKDLGGNWCKTIFVDVVHNNEMISSEEIAKSIWRKVGMENYKLG
ncbi:MAG: hypothetical protein JNM21_05120 [Taibaiella sp.]|nr:hypothetical protein [Taibaiella sp.]